MVRVLKAEEMRGQQCRFNVVEAIKHVPRSTENHWRMALDLGFLHLPIGLRSELGLSGVCIPQGSGSSAQWAVGSLQWAPADADN